MDRVTVLVAGFGTSPSSVLAGNLRVLVQGWPAPRTLDPIRKAVPGVARLGFPPPSPIPPTRPRHNGREHNLGIN